MSRLCYYNYGFKISMKDASDFNLKDFVEYFSHDDDATAVVNSVVLNGIMYIYLQTITKKAISLNLDSIQKRWPKGLTYIPAVDKGKGKDMYYFYEAKIESHIKKATAST